MASTRPVGEPYALAESRMPFVSWRFVRPGGVVWRDSAGKAVNVHGDQAWSEAKLTLTDSPSGVRLITHLAERGEPILSEQMPWEHEGYPILTTVLRDERRYRAWGHIGGWGDLKERGPTIFCYFESDDGLNWRRPDCGVDNFGEIKQTNLLRTSGGTVFIDPSAPAQERYKWINLDSYSPKEVEEYRKLRTCGIDYKSGRPDAGAIFGIKGAVSPDGLHWTTLPVPLAMMHSDTQIVAYYDVRLKQYVVYVRDWAVDELAPSAQQKEAPRRWVSIGRRCIGRAAGEDFRELPLSTIILEPPLWLPPCQTLYTNCRTSFPGAPEQHLMCPAVWDQSTDRTHLRFAVSSDGECWEWAGGEAGVILATAEQGEWDGGCIFASPNLIELPDGDFALLYTGYDVPHKYPRRRAKRATGYARWRKGRLSGIRADAEGSFSTIAVVPPSQKVSINAVVDAEGSIQVEAADLSGNPILGRTFADANPLSGDCFRRPVTWKSQDTLGTTDSVILRVRLRSATLYWVDFV